MLDKWPEGSLTQQRLHPEGRRDSADINSLMEPFFQACRSAVMMTYATSLCQRRTPPPFRSLNHEGTMSERKSLSILSAWSH